MNFLFAKSKVGFFYGSIKRPEKVDVDYMAWMHCDAIVKIWVTIAIETNI